MLWSVVGIWLCNMEHLLKLFSIDKLSKNSLPKWNFISYIISCMSYAQNHKRILPKIHLKIYIFHVHCWHKIPSPLDKGLGFSSQFAHGHWDKISKAPLLLQSKPKEWLCTWIFSICVQKNKKQKTKGIQSQPTSHRYWKILRLHPRKHTKLLENPTHTLQINQKNPVKIIQIIPHMSNLL